MSEHFYLEGIEGMFRARSRAINRKSKFFEVQSLENPDRIFVEARFIDYQGIFCDIGVTIWEDRICDCYFRKLAKGASAQKRQISGRFLKGGSANQIVKAFESSLDTMLVAQWELSIEKIWKEIVGFGPTSLSASI